MQAAKALIVGTLCTPWLAAERAPSPTGATIVASNARFELLYTRPETEAGGLTEGPAVAPDGSIYFSDILSGERPGRIHRFDPATKRVETFAADSGKANGLTFGPDGYLYAAEGADHGGRRISRWNVATKERSPVVDNFGGKLFNSPNDITIDDAGNLYFTDPRYVGHEPLELRWRAVYRVTPAGDVSEITREVSKPNGLALSPDGRTLYVAETDNGDDGLPGMQPGNRGPMRIYAFPLGPDGRVSGERLVFHDFGAQFGCDGMTVDEHGNLYLAAREPSRPGILVLDPRGAEIAFLPTAAGRKAEERPLVAGGLPSNVEFGLGEGADFLYVTAGQSLYRIRLKVRGFHRQHGR